MMLTVPVSLASLLAEMTDRHANVEFPTYRAAQMSSYDRRTVAPNRPGWFANEDGQGFIRIDTVGGRIERVLFDQNGPGAVTRIWMSTSDKRGSLRFYFDNESEPRLTIAAYDLARLPWKLGSALLQCHTHYEAEIEKTGGNTCYLPMPFARHLKITLECPEVSYKKGHYYHVGYRTYPAGTVVRSFTASQIEECAELLQQVNDKLLHPQAMAGLKTRTYEIQDGQAINLRGHNKAIENLAIQLKGVSADEARKVMDHTILTISFDGQLCVQGSLAQFFGGGKGAPGSASWYMDYDGKYLMRSRWTMPFRRNATIQLRSDGTIPLQAQLEVGTAGYKWNSNTLYFHATPHEETGLPVTNYWDTDKFHEWDFARLKGRGVYVGDVLSVNNHLKDWFGEGDEKIFVDDDTFPSFMGTGTEDYYNCSWAPVNSFLTPFGGVPRSDDPTSHGWTTWLRTRNADAIPFSQRFNFDFELQGWSCGLVDYYALSFWYGDL